MKFLEATPGETVYDFLNRALNMAHDEVKCIQATHSGTTISIYPQSYIQDLCDKYDLAKRLQK